MLFQHILENVREITNASDSRMEFGMMYSTAKVKYGASYCSSADVV